LIIRVEDVLGSRGRVRLLSLLVIHAELNITMLARMASLQHSSTERHLNALSSLKIVSEKRYGRIRIFSLNPKSPHVSAIRRLFTEWSSRQGEGLQEFV
jgi:DNA-binding transcriptional ArsR family regulator